jgi:DNA-binding MurR/RpiR family transcriptional regulator
VGDRGILLNIKQAMPSLPEQERKVADYAWNILTKPWDAPSPAWQLRAG